MARCRVTGVLALACTVAAGCGDDDWTSRLTAEGTIERPGEPSLHYVVLGDGGDTVVVLHGGPGLHMKYLLGPLAPLSHQHTLIFYDLRGRGESGPAADSTRLTLATEIADLDAVRAHFKLDKLELVGHHWGGAVAALYAVAHPDRVSRMALISPSVVHRSFLTAFTFIRGDSALWREATNHVGMARTAEEASAFCERFWPTYFTPLPPHPKTPYRAMAPAMCDVTGERLLHAEQSARWLSSSIGPTPWRESLNRTPTPTLVIEGAGDTTVTNAARRWAQHLPDARLLTLAEPYLFPWVGQTTQFRAKLSEFLSGEWPKGAIKPPPFSPPPVQAAGSPTKGR